MKEFNFVGKRHTFLFISFAGVVFSVLLLIFKGLNLGLDFTGGLLIQVRINATIDIHEMRKILSDGGIKMFDLQNVITGEKGVREYIIRVKLNVQEEEIVNRIKEIFTLQNFVYEILRKEYVGPTIGRHLTTRAGYAIIFSLIGIIFYVGIRFKSSIWGISGVVALFHDIMLTLGFLTLLGKEITLPVIAALLTLLGYSINDTIVIFDRVRENLHLIRKESLEKIVNLSINQMLKRTLLTSGTTFFAVVSLYILGNEIIKDFALSLIFGVIVGTYSSVYIASSLVLQFSRIGKK